MDKIYPEEHIQAIANAIRRKNGRSVNYLTSEMAGAIDQLVSYPEPTGTQTITENGIVDVKDKQYADVNVQASATLISKTITANGEYDAEDDEADGYSDVTVNVPNSYSASDEGKVVSNGALVAQTSTTVTQNGTVDTTLNDEVVVNVSGGSSIDTDRQYYNGYLLPKLPVAEGYPCAAIRQNNQNGYYDLLLTPNNLWVTKYLTSSPEYYSKSGGVLCNWYRVPINQAGTATEWDLFYEDYDTTYFGSGNNRPFVWTNTDIHFDSKTGSYLQLLATNPAPHYI